MTAQLNPDGRLEPTGKIEPQPWITAPETVAVMEALTANGGEARFIGGCVRDAILKRPVRDIDIATPAPPERVMERLEATGIRAVPTGLEHGTVTAVLNKVQFEVTTLRIDLETDGRRARVLFTDDWMADAARRDFTINTLSCSLSGEVFDPFDGLDDLAHAVVRFVGNPKNRVEEDVLRILRFFRLYADYGKPPPHIESLAACRAQAHRLGELSGERLRGETFRILLAPNPADIIALMRGEKILEHFLPEAENIGRLRMLSWLETTAINIPTVDPDADRRLAALLNVGEREAEDIADRFKLSNKRKDRLIRALKPGRSLSPRNSEREIRRALQHWGAESARDVALLTWAGDKAADPLDKSNGTEDWLGILEMIDRWEPKKFPLRGRDVLAQGVSAGPRIGRLLKAVEIWWEEKDYRPGYKDCLEKLKALMAN